MNEGMKEGGSWGVGGGGVARKEEQMNKEIEVA